MTPPRILGLIVLLILGTPAGAQEGALATVRADVRQLEATPPPQKRSRTSEAAPAPEDDPDWEEFKENLFLAPFLIPAALMKDDYAVPGYFAPYPYADGERGVLSRGWVPNRDLYPFLIRLGVEGSSAFDGLARYAGRLLLDTAWRIGGSASWTYFRERLDDRRTDHLNSGDLNALFRFAQSESVQLRAGLGARWLSDRQGTDWGAQVAVAGDYFPTRPLVLSTEGAWGTLGSAAVVHGRLTVGVLWRHWEAFGGYDYLRIGRTDLQGPVAGLRWWF